MEHTTILTGILLLLVMSVAAVAAFRLFHLPPILGYLLVGAITSEHALGWLPENESIEFMGEVGVVFLLFAIGLEFSIRQFMALRTILLGLGGLQVTISTLTGFSLLYYFGVSLEGAVIAAGAMALSSTAIVIKQLTDQGEMHTQHGQLSLSILLFQDLAVVPFLIIIPFLAGDGGDSESTLGLMLSIGAKVLMLAGMVVLGFYALRPLFHFVARTHSVELFNITVLLVALTAAWITESLGLSLALGAFLAGMLLSETEYKHQIESEIRPFRDILMGLFFITVGAKLNLSVLPDLWLPILLLVLGLTIGKALLIAALSRLFVADNGTSLRTGLVLAHGGEFGFALLALALSNNLLTDNEVQTALAAIVISMALAPILIRYSDRLTKILFSDSYLRKRYKEAHDFSIELKEVEDHVIICGYRRVGQSLGRFLHEQNIPHVGLELDAKIIQEAWEAGDQVYYADATRPEILIAAGLYRARMVVITVADVETAKRITEAARKKKKDIPIVVRTHDDSHIGELESLGATEVLPETLEASVMITSRVLERLGLSPAEVFHIAENIRAEGYRALRSFFHGESSSSKKRKHDSEMFLHTLVLQDNDDAIGKSIGELGLADYDVTVKTLRRGNIRGDQPSTELNLQEEDTLVLESQRKERLVEVERLIRGDKKTKSLSQENAV